MVDLMEELKGLDIADFAERSRSECGDDALKAGGHPRTMQLNIGRRCNLVCAHCHLECGPGRTEMMSKDVMEACIEAFERFGFSIADITGGAPEMNPGLEWLIEEMSRLGKVMVRTNLAILEDPQYSHLIEVYRRNGVQLICSLPCYGRDGVDAQRGEGVYDACIRILGKLNSVGFGVTDGIELDLVFNPGDPALPPSQDSLEGDYKRNLADEHGISFDRLFTIANSPLGRFGKRLVSSGELGSYMDLLTGSFNPLTVSKLMCLDQVSVGPDGRLYDCDGNQAAGLPITRWGSIFDLLEKGISPREVRTAEHCYSCTAGCGSSCGGSLTTDAGSESACGCG